MSYIIAQPCIGTKDTACVAGLPGRLHPSAPKTTPSSNEAENALHRPRCSASTAACASTSARSRRSSHLEDPPGRVVGIHREKHGLLEEVTHLIRR